MSTSKTVCDATADSRGADVGRNNTLTKSHVVGQDATPQVWRLVAEDGVGDPAFPNCLACVELLSSDVGRDIDLLLVDEPPDPVDLVLEKLLRPAGRLEQCGHGVERQVGDLGPRLLIEHFVEGRFLGFPIGGRDLNVVLCHEAH